MNRTTKTSSQGLTLIEVMIACVALAITVLGAISYQYHTVKHTRSCRAEKIALGMAQLLIEDWKSTGGSEGYDPLALHLGITQDGEEYQATVDQLPLHMILEYQDIATDESAGTALREIRVTVRWRKNFSAELLETDDPALVLATYVRRDSASG